jgi:DNA-directed RNA polymerase subunit RPC12/RpoP
MSDEISEREIYQCSDCKAEVDENSIVCPKCGAKFESEKKEIVNTGSKSGVGSKVISIISTIVVIMIVSSISPIIKYCSNSENAEYSDYDDWEKISLSEIGISFSTPCKLEKDNSIQVESDFMNTIYTGSIPGMQIAILGGTINSGYFYDLEKGAEGSMNTLRSNGTFSDLNYNISEWTRHKFENKVIRGTFSANGEKGSLVSLFGKKNNKLFSILILISPTSARSLDLAELFILSVEFL